MSDIPIIFSASMILALLAGRKSMTRRLAWRSETDKSKMSFVCGGEWPNPLARRAKGFGVQMGCEYWLRPTPWLGVKQGDRLWVREGWRAHSTFDGTKPRDIPKSTVWYLADTGYQPQSKVRPSIFMPRWASRLTLIINATKIERLQEISETECIAEGAEIIKLAGNPVDDGPMVRLSPSHVYGTPRTWFRELWDKLHGPGSWDANPEVCAISFTVHKTNIDAMPKAEAT